MDTSLELMKTGHVAVGNFVPYMQQTSKNDDMAKITKMSCHVTIIKIVKMSVFPQSGQVFPKKFKSEGDPSCIQNFSKIVTWENVWRRIDPLL